MKKRRLHIPIIGRRLFSLVIGVNVDLSFSLIMAYETFRVVNFVFQKGAFSRHKEGN